MSNCYKLPDGKWVLRLTGSDRRRGCGHADSRRGNQRRERAERRAAQRGETEGLFRCYSAWQHGLPEDSEERESNNTLKENEKNETPKLLRVFVKVKPASIKLIHHEPVLADRACVENAE